MLHLQEGRGGAAAWWKRSPEAWGPGQRLLACGAQVIAELRAAVLEELGYSCSAGELPCLLSGRADDWRTCDLQRQRRGKAGPFRAWERRFTLKYLEIAQNY